MRNLIAFVLSLVIFVVIVSSNSAAGLFLSKKHDGVIYKVELTTDKSADKICALLYKNRDIEEVYNMEIENSDRFPIFPDSFKIDDSGNLKACFRFSAVADNFSLAIIKFDSKSLAIAIEFSNISLTSVPEAVLF